jgi:hypothetical protein
MSPGTSSSAAMPRRSPLRITAACGARMRRIASSADSALPSWMKPIAAFAMTTASITSVSTHAPSAVVIAAQMSST